MQVKKGALNIDHSVIDLSMYNGVEVDGVNSRDLKNEVYRKFLLKEISEEEALEILPHTFAGFSTYDRNSAWFIANHEAEKINAMNPSGYGEVTAKELIEAALNEGQGLIDKAEKRKAQNQLRLIQKAYSCINTGKEISSGVFKCSDKSVVESIAEELSNQIQFK